MHCNGGSSSGMNYAKKTWNIAIFTNSSVYKNSEIFFLNVLGKLPIIKLMRKPFQLVIRQS